MKYVTYIGHTTDDRSVGIQILESDADTGSIRELGVVKIDNSTYMDISRDGKRLYMSCSSPAFGGKGGNGGLAAFHINGTKLEKFDEKPTGFTAACHVSLSPDDKALVFAEYSNARVGYQEIDDKGGFSSVCMQAPLSGTCGPSKPRQDKPHAHCARVTPDGKYVCYVDLGLDEVKVFDFANRRTSFRELPEKSFHTLPAGAGPRHIIFHPNGKLALLVFELGNRVASYKYADGLFTQVASLPLLPEGFSEFSKAAAIKLSSDGKRVFCSNRGHDSISAFDLDPETGALAPKAIMPLGGSFPRDFEFMPGEKFLLAGLKMDGVLRVYAYDKEACSLKPVKDLPGYHRPLYVRFAAPIA